MPPICPPPRTALWLAEEARPRQVIEAEQLRQAVQAEPVPPSLGELVWADFNRQYRRPVNAASDRPGLLPPPPPVTFPFPKPQKGATHV